MRTNVMNEVKKKIENYYLAVITERMKVATYDNCYATGYFIKDTVDSEDLNPNISGVVEPQNKILYQFEMNPAKKCLEMLEEIDEKKDDSNKMRPSTDGADKMMNDNQSFFGQFDESVKHEIHKNTTDNLEIAELNKSNTWKSEEKQINLKECIDRMKEDLNDTHYITDESLDAGYLISNKDNVDLEDPLLNISQENHQ